MEPETGAAIIYFTSAKVALLAENLTPFNRQDAILVFLVQK